MEHHTKTKGDAGVGFVLADCLQNNVQVCLPISEHLAFDVVVVSPEGALRRLQVKYVTAKKGAITVDIRGVWSDRHGTHVNPRNHSTFDALAIYCPTTKEVYYLRSDEFEGQRVNLRLMAPRNGQVKGVRMASSHKGPLRLFQFP